MYCFVIFQKGLRSTTSNIYRYIPANSHKTLTNYIPVFSGRITLSTGENRMKIRSVVFEFIADRQTRRRTLFCNIKLLFCPLKSTSAYIHECNNYFFPVGNFHETCSYPDFLNHFYVSYKFQSQACLYKQLFRKMLVHMHCTWTYHFNYLVSICFTILSVLRMPSLCLIIIINIFTFLAIFINPKKTKINFHKLTLPFKSVLNLPVFWFKVLQHFYCYINKCKMFRRLRWAGCVARMKEGRSAFKILTGIPTGKRPLGKPRHRWEDNIIVDPK